MGWVLVLLVALLTGGVGLLLGGVVMAACVRWFRVSSFEGKSGYAIVAMALLGLIVGFLVGLITALTLPADASLPFLRALGIAVGLVAGAAGLAALVARLVADVPPRLDGRELLLDVEVRLPAGQTQLPDIPADQAYVELGALKGRVRRRAGQVRPTRRIGPWPTSLSTAGIDRADSPRSRVRNMSYAP